MINKLTVSVPLLPSCTSALSLMISTLVQRSDISIRQLVVMKTKMAQKDDAGGRSFESATPFLHASWHGSEWKDELQC